MTEPQEPSHFSVVDDTSSTSAEADHELAFDKLRIENHTALRMGAIRARSWWLIAMCMSGLIVLDMIGKTIIFIWVLHQWSFAPIIYLLIAGLMAWFTRHAASRAADFKREIARSAIPDPTTPPDFSTLSNGDDRWKDLENVR